MAKNAMSRSDENRLEDYINDQFQTTADFNNIDDLLANVALQKKQLDEQLQDARSKLATSKKLAAEHEFEIRKKADEFSRHETDVQRRLAIITSSESVKEATKLLQGPLEQLRRVELAKLYVELLEDVDNLAVDARKYLPQSPKDALRPYTQLKELAISLRRLQDVAEGAGVHLVTHVEETTERLWTDMKKIMTDEFDSVLTKSNWPKAIANPSKEWTECFEKLLDLQQPELTTAEDGAALILLPFGVLTKHFTQNFRYQFMANRPTSELHHLGDYFIGWFVREVEKHENYLRDNITPILAAHFHGDKLSYNLLYIDAVSAFITALLPVLREKVNSIVASIPPTEPGWLSRFIEQLLTFDEELRTKFHYDGGDIEHGWKGVTWDVLETSFDRWLAVEKEFGQKRYYEITKSPKSNLIDDDSAPLGRTKSTYGANQVTDLLMSITQSYNRLRRFSHKARFLIEIQAELFDQYQGHLSESLGTYQTVTSSLARRLHGIHRDEAAKLEGVKGLDWLCRVYGSADHVIDTLRDWSVDDFFVDLWEELQSKAKKTSEDDNLAGPISYAVVKESTSAEVGTDSEVGSVFDTTIAGYDRLRTKSIELLTRAFTNNFSTLFSQYTTRAQWTTIGELDDSVAISSELDQPLKTLKEELSFLTHHLAPTPFRKIWRPTYAALQDHLWSEVLTRQQFTTLGAARFALDIAAIQAVVDNACVVYRGKGAETTMAKLVEGVRLLNLPQHVDGGTGEMSLQDAGRALFESGAEGKLVEMGFLRLSKLEARAILQARMELKLD